MAENKFDIIVYGATSFVGQIITRYMHEQFTDESIAWQSPGVRSVNFSSSAIGSD